MKRLDKIERIEDVQIERPDLRINFSLDKQPGRVLVTLKDVTKRYGANTIVENGSAEINRGDKIALIGANGRGKSTLLRIIAGAEPFEGERIWGHNVDESFYAQHQLEALDVNLTVLDEMKGAGSKKTELELRSLLGCFLFSGDDVEKKIKVLSGGEKARVALAKTIVSKANFLLLDEPTNHLDMHSVNLLIEALNKYEGTIILVSHDRYFVEKTANKIWEIDENHEIKEFVGHYEEWVDWKVRAAAKVQAEAQAAKALAAPAKGNSNSASGQQKQKSNAAPVAAAPVKQAAPIDKESKKELQKHQRRFEQVEKDLADLQKQKVQLEADLGNPSIYGDKNKFVATEKTYKEVNGKIVELTKEYEVLFEKIMELGE